MLSFPNAKINLGLHVVQKRNDGYHNLETVFYPVKVRDALEINAAVKTSFTAAGTAIPGNPANNICLEAFKLLERDHPLSPQKITLLKHIPVGAGMGGGSADAAFLLKMLNIRFNLGLSALQLTGYARQLGADCAFFINNTPVYATARGDVFEPVEIDLSGYYLVLVQPPVAVATQDAYAGISPKAPSVSLKELLKQPVETWKTQLINDFEGHIFIKHPIIKELKAALYAQGAIFAQMSGSGSSVYGIFKEPVALSLPPGHTVFYNI